MTLLIFWSHVGDQILAISFYHLWIVTDEFILKIYFITFIGPQRSNDFFPNHSEPHDSLFAEAETEQALQVQSAMSGGTIVGLSLLVLFLVIIIIDLLCYLCFRKGITHAMVTRSRERSRAGEKEKVMEEGEK